MDIEALGRKALTDALRQAGGLKSSYASLLVNGHKSPSLDKARELEDLTGIPARFWSDHKDTRGAAMWARITQEKK